MKTEKQTVGCKSGVGVIEQHIANIYEEENIHSVTRERFDLAHILSHVDAYKHPGDANEDVPPHWHYVTYGLSKLDIGSDQEENLPNSHDDASGFGFELTFRLKRQCDESGVPKWPLSILMALAEYVQSTGNLLNIGDHIPWSRPLDETERDLDDPDRTLRDESDIFTSLIQHILITEDPELMVTDTPTGSVQFRQLIGVLEPEIKAAQSWKGCGVLDLISLSPQAGGAYFVTDMRRDTSVFDHQPYFIKLVGSEISSGGSNLAHVTALCSWEGDYRPDSTPEIMYDSAGSTIEEHILDAVTLHVDTAAADLLPVAARGRLAHGRFFLFENLSGDVILFIPEGCDEPMVSVSYQTQLKAQGSALQIYCSREFIFQMTEAFNTFFGHKKLSNMAREIHLTNPQVTIVIADMKNADHMEPTSCHPVFMPLIQQSFSARVPRSLTGSDSTRSIDTEFSSHSPTSDLSCDDETSCSYSTSARSSILGPQDEQPNCQLIEFPPPPPDLLHGICFTEDLATTHESITTTDGGHQTNEAVAITSCVNTISGELRITGNTTTVRTDDVLRHKPPLPTRSSSTRSQIMDGNRPCPRPRAIDPSIDQNGPAIPVELKNESQNQRDVSLKKTFHITPSLDKPTPLICSTGAAVDDTPDTETESERGIQDSTTLDFSMSQPIGVGMDFSYADEDDDVTCEMTFSKSSDHATHETFSNSCSDEIVHTSIHDGDKNQVDELSLPPERNVVHTTETYTSLTHHVKANKPPDHQMDSKHALDKKPKTRNANMTKERSPQVITRKQNQQNQGRQYMASQPASRESNGNVSQMNTREKTPLERTGSVGNDQGYKIYHRTMKPEVPPKPEHFKQSAIRAGHIGAKKYKSYTASKETNNNIASFSPMSISEKLLSGFSDLAGVGFTKLSNVEIPNVDRSGLDDELTPSSNFVYHSAYKPYGKEHFFSTKKRPPKKIQPEVDLNDTFMAIENMEWDDLPNPSQGNLVDFRPQSTSSTLSDRNDDSFPIQFNKYEDKSTEMVVFPEDNSAFCSDLKPEPKDLSVLVEESFAEEREDSLTPTPELRSEIESVDFEHTCVEVSSRSWTPTATEQFSISSSVISQNTDSERSYRGNSCTLRDDTSLESDTSFVILSDVSNTSFDPNLSFIPAPVMRKRKRRSVPNGKSGSTIPVDIVRPPSAGDVQKMPRQQVPYSQIKSNSVDIGRYLVSSPKKLTSQKELVVNNQKNQHTPASIRHHADEVSGATGSRTNALQTSVNITRGRDSGHVHGADGKQQLLPTKDKSNRQSQQRIGHQESTGYKSNQSSGQAAPVQGKTQRSVNTDLKVHQHQSRGQRIPSERTTAHSSTKYLPHSKVHVDRRPVAETAVAGKHPAGKTQSGSEGYDNLPRRSSYNSSRRTLSNNTGSSNVEISKHRHRPDVKQDESKRHRTVPSGASPKNRAHLSEAGSPNKAAAPNRQVPQQTYSEKSRRESPQLIRPHQDNTRRKDNLKASNNLHTNNDRGNPAAANVSSSSISRKSASKLNTSHESNTSVSSLRSSVSAKQTPQSFRAQKARQAEGSYHQTSSSNPKTTQSSAEIKNLERNVTETKERKSRVSATYIPPQKEQKVKARVEQMANIERSSAPRNIRQKERTTPAVVCLPEGSEREHQNRSVVRPKAEIGRSTMKRRDIASQHRVRECLPASFTPQMYMNDHQEQTTIRRSAEIKEECQSNTLPRYKDKPKSRFKIQNPYETKSSEV